MSVLRELLSRLTRSTPALIKVKQPDARILIKIMSYKGCSYFSKGFLYIEAKEKPTSRAALRDVMAKKSHLHIPTWITICYFVLTAWCYLLCARNEIPHYWATFRIPRIVSIQNLRRQILLQTLYYIIALAYRNIAQ